MLRTTLGVGLFLGVLIFLNNTPAHATSAHQLDGDVLKFSFQTVGKADKKVEKPKKQTEKKEKPVKKTPKKELSQHTVKKGESLTAVAKKHNSTWQRLFAKNTSIKNPDLLKVGDTLTIPKKSETLPKRQVPKVAPQPTPANTNQVTTSYAPTRREVNSPGNTYSDGYCTWYAKDRRPDLPNSLGNANQWVARAQALGINTGSTPRAGAVGQQGMHVVYVESVNNNGTVTVSEMNYKGLYVVSSRTVSAGSFVYIY